jgi:hypothetical protein
METRHLQWRWNVKVGSRAQGREVGGVEGKFTGLFFMV